jgi:Acetyltransferases
MFSIEKANYTHLDFWLTLDKYISLDQLKTKISLQQCYIISNENMPCGVLRYGLFWDSIPFVNMIYLQDSFRNKGLGKCAVTFWENEMLSQGYKTVMTSTLSTETAQHFYRKLGYKDAGCLILDKEPLEIILVKNI